MNANVVPSAASAPDVSPLAVAIREALPPPSAVPPAGDARVSIRVLSTATDADLIGFCQSVLTGMAGNAAYPAPAPKLADINTAYHGFIAAVDAAKDSRRMIVVRKQQRVALCGMLRDLAHYVQVTCNGDLPTLLSSGFKAQRGRQRAGLLPAPGNLRLVRGPVSGQLIARCRRLDGARTYEWRYADAVTPTVWVALEPTFGATTRIDGLVPGTQYLVQARARGTAGVGNWSDSAVLMVV